MKRIIPALLVLCVLLTHQTPAQTPAQSSATPPTPTPAATIQARSNLVILDVVVTDKNHAPIHDLKAADFQVREAGALQTVKTLEEHSPATAKPPQPFPALSPGIYTNFEPTPADGPLNILLLDRLNTPLASQTFLHDQLVAFVRTMKPGTRIAIFGLGTHLYLLQGFTTDPSVLLAALSSKKNLPGQSPLLGSPAPGGNDSASEALTEASAGSFSPVSPEVIANLLQFESDTQSFQTQLRVRYTLEAMNDLARFVAGFSGRKNLIWFSGSFPLSILPDSTLPNPFSVVADMQDQFRATTSLLTRAQVAVYPVDARGLQSSPVMDASQNSGARYTRNPAAFAKDTADFSKSQAEEHTTMYQMASDTGGQAFVNTNGLAAAVTRAIDQGSSYYTLTYTPTDPKTDGSFRKIQVTLDRPGLETSYRRGYFADSPTAAQRKQLTASPAAPATPDQQTVHNAMLRGAPLPTQILLKVLVTPAGPPTDESVDPANQVATAAKGPFRKYNVNYAVSPRDVTFRVTSPGHFQTAVEFVCVTYDANGAAVTSLRQPVHANLDADGLKTVARTGLQFHQIISVPANGSFFLRAAVHDLSADHIGAVELPIAAVKNLAVVAPEPPRPAPPTLNTLPR